MRARSSASAGSSPRSSRRSSSLSPAPSGARSIRSQRRSFIQGAVYSGRAFTTHERAREADRVDQPRQERVALRVEPLRVVEEQQGRGARAARLHQPADEREQALAAGARVDAARPCPGSRPRPRKSSTSVTSSGPTERSVRSPARTFLRLVAGRSSEVRPRKLRVSSSSAGEGEGLAVRRTARLARPRRRARASGRRRPGTAGSCRPPASRTRRRRRRRRPRRGRSAASSAATSRSRPTKREKPRAREASMRVRFAPGPTSSKLFTSPRTPFIRVRPAGASSK